jgi:hypothetical protein
MDESTMKVCKQGLLDNLSGAAQIKDYSCPEKHLQSFIRCQGHPTIRND